MLDKDQKQFIENKVRALGSMEKAKEFYKQTSLVCAYANQTARKLFKEKTLKGRSK